MNCSTGVDGGGGDGTHLCSGYVSVSAKRFRSVVVSRVGVVCVCVCVCVCVRGSNDHIW